MRHFLIIDIATTAIPDVDGFLEEPSAPANYKDPEKIAAYVAEKKRDMADRCALDPDLGRITAVGACSPASAWVQTCPTEDAERETLITVAREIRGRDLITFNGFRFDLHCLQRRARYLGVPFPKLDTDRYRSSNVDLCEILTSRGQLPSHSLGFYVKRLGWTDLAKPLTGAEEARVPETGRWDDLAASVRHDIEATQRLASWLGVIDAVPFTQPTLPAAVTA